MMPKIIPRHLGHITSHSHVLFLSLFVFISIQSAQCSPPLDYFLHSQQYDLSQQNFDESADQPYLPSIESIYHLSSNSRDLAARVLELIQNVSHTHDNDKIDLEATRYAWHLMEEQALQYMRSRVKTVLPIVRILLNESQVTNECQMAVEHWLTKLQDLEHWATLMWNSWGEFPPAGLFEGTYTDLGSYRGCLSVKNNEMIGQAQYCTLDYQPLVPTRPRFHSIYKKALSLDERTKTLTGGDFESAYKGDRSISSSHTAHSYESTKYRMFWNDNNTTKLSSDESSRARLSNYTLKEAIQPSQTLNSETLIELAERAQYFYYVKFRIGACFPSKCSRDDVQRLAQTAGKRAILQVGTVDCNKKEKKKLNGYQLTAIWILSSMASLGILGTIVEILKVNPVSSPWAEWLLSFSIWTNAKRLFDTTSTDSAHSDLECIHGLRFFSMLWVIYGHTVLYNEYQFFSHAYDVVERQASSLLALPSFNANFSVDTFFVISGILTTYVTWEYMRDGGRKFNKFGFAVSRYIRLTPQLVIVILCFFLLPLFGDGPMYKQITEEQANLCYSYWPINLLYLQCYVNSKKICIDPSWWLSIEMTFHFISMIVIIAMINNPTRGMVVNFLVAATLTLWGAIIHYSNGFAIQYMPSIPQKYEVVSEQTKMFFHKPYPHAPSYFIGVALGYILANKIVRKLTKSQEILGWTVCMSGFMIVLLGTYFWNMGAPYSQLTATAYYHLCQILWPTSIAWIVLACSLNRGGFIQSILSARVFVPLGRITYMTYLSHALIIYFHSASMNLPMEPSLLAFIYMFTANTSLSIALGVLLTVVYEVPVVNLQRVIFRALNREEVTVLSPADTNGLSNQLIIESNDVGASKISQIRQDSRKNSINNINTDDSKH